MKRKILAIFTAFILLTLTACGSSSSGDANTESAGTGDAAQTSGEVKTIVVATRGDHVPFSYVDENNNLTGFDVEVVRKIDELLPDVQFEFQTMNISAAFVALDGGQVDMIANQMAHNEERDSKYYFNEIPYAYSYNYLVVPGSVNDIASFEDLQGKTVAVIPTAVVATQLEEFNASHDPQINVNYFEGGQIETIQQVATGQADATFAMKPTLQSAIDENGYDLKAVGDPVNGSGVFFILRQEEENAALIEELDNAIQQMLDDGTLADLSIQFLGDDFTQDLLAAQ